MDVKSKLSFYFVSTIIIILILLPNRCLSTSYTNVQDVRAINNLYLSLGSPALTGWTANGGDPCSDGWQGVRCRFVDIINITLNAANLSGELGDSLGNFSAMKIINLSNNNIGGSIPENLPITIEKLDLSSNKLGGPLPATMANLSVLTTLNVQQNHLNGVLGVLKALPLKDLNIENNSFSGPIPKKLFSIPNFKKDGNPFNTSPIISPSAQPPCPAPGPPKSHSNLKPLVRWGLVSICFVVIFSLMIYACCVCKCQERVSNRDSVTDGSSQGRSELEMVRAMSRADQGNDEIMINVDELLLPSPLVEAQEQFTINQKEKPNTSTSPPNPQPPASAMTSPESFSVPELQQYTGGLSDHNINRPIQKNEDIMINADNNCEFLTPAPSPPRVVASKAEPEKLIKNQKENPRISTSPPQEYTDAKRNVDNSHEISTHPPSPPLVEARLKTAQKQVTENYLKGSASTFISLVHKITQRSTPVGPPYYTKDDFSDHNLIRKCWLGNVYLVQHPNEEKRDVMKMDDAHSIIPMNKFEDLTTKILQLRHPNVMELVRFHPHDRLLVYSHFSKRTLKDVLCKDESRKHFPWKARVDVAISVANALMHLHETCGPESKNILLDEELGPCNILLDEKFSVRIADCGLASLMSPNSFTQLFSTELSDDMCNFIIVLIQLFTDLKPLERSSLLEEQNLVEWTRSNWSDRDKLARLIDPAIKEQCSECSIGRFGNVIGHCFLPRQPMSTIVGLLEYVLAED